MKLRLILVKGWQELLRQGKIDGEEVDLRTVVDKDCELNILTFNDEKGKGAFSSYSISYYGAGD